MKIGHRLSNQEMGPLTGRRQTGELPSGPNLLVWYRNLLYIFLEFPSQ